MNAPLRRPYKVTGQTVLLGLVLDLQLELAGGEERVFIREWEGWAMLTSADGMDRAPGRTPLYLVPFSEMATKVFTRETGRAAAETYMRWHRRHPERALELEVPDAFAYPHGRVLRIGYTSDKWERRGEPHDYDHDFKESGRAPLLYTDSPELERAGGAVIIGGDMRVTPGGID